VVDVIFDGRRLFSINPAELERARGGLRAPWPKPLTRFLHGETELTVRSHVSGVTVARQQVRFDDRGGRVEVVDREGNPLGLDKWGNLIASFADEAPTKSLMLADTEDLLRDLADLGMDAFIAYGTLLGAVRQGTVLGHDTDVDVAYYSRFEHPADVMVESLRLERRLRERGWTGHRRTGAFTQLERTDATGPERHVDLFAAYHCQGWFSMHKWVRGRLPREAILPLGEVTLEGRRFPAPRDPEALLALTYGEDWRTPDPSFTFDYTPEMRGRAEPWFGDWRREKDKWRRANLVAPTEESAFARHVAPLLEDGVTVVDLGCGAGRDALWFAGRGHPVIGADYLPSSSKRAAEEAGSRGRDLRVEAVSLYDLRTALAFATRVALDDARPVIYARHLLDALRPVGLETFWILAKTLLGRGGRVFAEFYTSDDEDGTPQRPPAPFRRLDPASLRAQVERHGGRVESEEMLREDGLRVCRWELVVSC